MSAHPNQFSPAQLEDSRSLRRPETPADIGPTPTVLRAHTRDRRVQLILMLLEENPERPWEVTEIAKTVNLSPGRLAHLFKSEIGVSIQQYLTQLRLTKARHQLESSFLSIKEIAASVGFRSVTRFTASFKTALGTTPAEYRRHPTLAHSTRKGLAIARSANR